MLIYKWIDKKNPICKIQNTYTNSKIKRLIIKIDNNMNFKILMNQNINKNEIKNIQNLLAH